MSHVEEVCAAIKREGVQPKPGLRYELWLDRMCATEARNRGGMTDEEVGEYRKLLKGTMRGRYAELGWAFNDMIDTFTGSLPRPLARLLQRVGLLDYAEVE